MEQIVAAKLVVLINNTVLISQIEEVQSELGEPDCKLTKPYVVDTSDLNLVPWLSSVSVSNIFMISSDKILTISEPKPTLLEKYLDLTLK